MSLSHRLSERWHRAVRLPPMLVLVMQVGAAVYLSTAAFLALWVVAPTVINGWTPTVITSDSMAPTIRAGDVVLIAADRQPTLGSVITYESFAGQLVTHRVIDLDDDGNATTKGDRNEEPDARTVPPSAVVGRGTLVVPVVGLPAVWRDTSLPMLGTWMAATSVAILLVVVVRPPARPEPVETPPEDGDGWEWPETVAVQ